MRAAGDAGAMCPAGLAYVPPGTFTMGCDDRSRCDPDEMPAHEVTLTQGTCWMPTGVTERQIEERKRDHPGGVADSIETTCDIQEPRGGWNAIKRFFGFAPKPRTETCDKPVNCVDWFQADAYCREMGMRLPTEAERERAARGESGRDEYGTSNGRLTDDQRRPLAQYGKWDLRDGRADVGSFPPKIFGDARIFDLSGNLWEWVSDWHGPYAAVAKIDPEGPATTRTYRIARGGSWHNRADNTLHNSWFDRTDNAPHELRAAMREYFFPEMNYLVSGFRCVADPRTP